MLSAAASAARASPRAAASLATKSRLCRPLSTPAFLARLPSSSSSSRHHRRASSSFHEPATLFGSSSSHPSASASPVSAVEGKDDDDDRMLRSDVRTMGALLGDAIRRHHGEAVFAKVEALRAIARERRKTSGAEDAGVAKLAEMATFAGDLTDDELGVVGRAFAHFLGVANAAEAHQMGRRNKLDLVREQRKAAAAAADADGSGPPPPVGALHAFKRDSTGGVLADLVFAKGVSREDVRRSLCTQQVELVLTAHPTQVNRRTLLEKHGRVQAILHEADKIRGSPSGDVNDVGTPYQRGVLDDALRREIASIWQTDEVARSKPSVQVEAERGTLVVETVLWEVLPTFLRKLDATMKWGLADDTNDGNGTGMQNEEWGLPLTAAPFKFASWMGGDRDGNPNVTPDVTREVCWTNRAKAARLYERDVLELVQLISGDPPKGKHKGYNCEAYRKIKERAGEGSRAPYRGYLMPVASKLAKTAEYAEQQLSALRGCPTASSAVAISTDDIYLQKSELMDELLTVHASLRDTGNAVSADGRLTDAVRKLAAFGLTLVPLDVRQESDNHEEALDCITKYLGLGSYSQWDEETRVNWITQQLQSKRPLIRSGAWNEETSSKKNNKTFFTPTSIDTLETFRMIAEQPDESLGAYVISQCTTASDILAVLLLQRDAGVETPLRVVPLFETLDDLNGAAETMEKLFSIPAYVGTIQGKQEVMIGYSDSAKDAGRLAASWAQYETQVALADVAKKHGVELTYFHGKGGTVGRGGNPATFDAILSHAPGTINGQFRVTEQGEMINQNFGYADRAERTLDIYTAAVLAEKNTARPLPSKEWKDMMDKLSEISCDAYRKIVRGDERFVPYFRAATPELELSNLNIGSRPAKRKATGGVESLRAIPWIFAWTQTRLNLPTWLGVGEAINEVLASKDEETLRTMYRDWGSFRTTIDLVEMILSKSEPTIARHYEDVLVSDPDAKALGNEVRKIHEATEQAVLNLSGHSVLSEDNRMLLRLMSVRNPYVDCLNILQAETMKRLRQSDEGSDEEKVLKDALLTTITGVANGMGNTG